MPETAPKGSSIPAPVGVGIGVGVVVVLVGLTMFAVALSSLGDTN